MGNPVSCSEELDCAGECGGSAVEDECGVCGGLGYNDGGCCGDETSCLSFANINTIFETEYNSTRCTDCHGGNGGLILTTYSALMSGGNNGPVIIPLDSENSNLILIEKFINQTPSNSNVINYFDLEEGSSLIHLVIQRNVNDSTLQFTSYANCHENTKLDQLVFNCSDTSGRNHHYATLLGQYSEASLKGVFFGSKKCLCSAPQGNNISLLQFLRL